MAILIDRELSFELMRKIHEENCRKSLDEIGKFILLLIEKISHKKRWIRFYGVFKEEMVDYAMIECVKGIWRFQPHRGATPYTFFQMIIEKSFGRALERRKDIPVPISKLKGTAKDMLKRKLGLYYEDKN